MSDNTRDIDYSAFNSKLSTFVGGLGPDERTVMNSILGAAQSQLHGGGEVSGYELNTVNELIAKVDWNGIMSSPTGTPVSIERHATDNNN